MPVVFIVTDLRKLHVMQQFWDQRYRENENVYGPYPNEFFREQLEGLKPASLLLPAEGEGRNAVHAAALGWRVDAFDYSPVAREKALRSAEKQGVHIRYELTDISEYVPNDSYDLIGLFYVHLPPALRVQFHARLAGALRPGGRILLEAFSGDQVRFSSGGPSDPAMLYGCSMLKKDFPGLQVLHCGELTVDLDEGAFHRGKASVVRMILSGS